jgi:hypothetical protein
MTIWKTYEVWAWSCGFDHYNYVHNKPNSHTGALLNEDAYNTLAKALDIQLDSDLKGK